ncbi:hypothetical protein K3495_g10547 [Podosphaera aphanis]|nr:hypothetical protein K3495_g10547 [Podosphaera aphanis]
MRKYQTKPLGQINQLLGIRVVRNESTRKIWLLQDAYLENLAKEFNIDEIGVKKPTTPLPRSPLYPNSGQVTAREIQCDQQRVGKLNYAAVLTRLYIAHVASKLSEFLQNPSREHMEAADHMIRYLCGTKYRGIKYGGNVTDISCRTFVASSDASFADDPETRYSSNGFCLQLFNGMIHWKATKQKSVTTSSTEAELLALTITAKEYIWWISLLQICIWTSDHR